MSATKNAKIDAKKTTTAAKKSVSFDTQKPIEQTTQAVTASKDAYGNRFNSRAHVINETVQQMREALTVKQITALVHSSASGKAYEKENGYAVKAISNHMLYLEMSGYVIHENGKYRLLTRDEQAKQAKERASSAAKIAAELAKK